MDRKSITFEQAEGLAPLPSQLKPKGLSQQLRALLWNAVYQFMKEDIIDSDYSEPYVNGKWERILRDKHLVRDHGMADEFNTEAEPHIIALKDVYATGSCAEVLGLTEWIMRHRSKPAQFPSIVERILEHCKAAYRVVDGDTIVPLATEEEAATLAQAFDDLKVSEFRGAYSHLKNATSALTNGKHADSVRESIHAVESVARVIAPKDKLSDALAELTAKTNMHKGMRSAFSSLYGYTSEERGIRHPLLDEGDATVDEADALFMIGACAAFVSYMIAKGRAAGILKS
jgi:hypothetical protein